MLRGRCNCAERKSFTAVGTEYVYTPSQSGSKLSSHALHTVAGREVFG